MALEGNIELWVDVKSDRTEPCCPGFTVLFFVFKSNAFFLISREHTDAENGERIIT